MEGEHVERDELRRLGKQRSGDAGIDRRQGVDGDQAAAGCHADRAGAQPVVLERAERQAEGRVHDQPCEKKEEERDRQAVGGGGPAVEIEAEEAEDRVDDHAAQAVGAAGPFRCLVGDLEEDRGDAEGDHQPCQVGPAKDQEARSKAEDPRGDTGDEQAEDRLMDAMDREQAGDIGTATEKRGVAEGDDPGIAENEIERERKQPENGDLVDQEEPARKYEDGGDRGEPEDDFERTPGGGASEKDAGGLRDGRPSRRSSGHVAALVHGAWRRLLPGKARAIAHGAIRPLPPCGGGLSALASQGAKRPRRLRRKGEGYPAGH